MYTDRDESKASDALMRPLRGDGLQRNALAKPSYPTPATYAGYTPNEPDGEAAQPLPRVTINPRSPQAAQASPVSYSAQQGYDPAQASPVSFHSQQGYDPSQATPVSASSEHQAWQASLNARQSHEPAQPIPSYTQGAPYPFEAQPSQRTPISYPTPQTADVQAYEPIPAPEAAQPTSYPTPAFSISRAEPSASQRSRRSRLLERNDIQRGGIAPAAPAHQPSTPPDLPVHTAIPVPQVRPSDEPVDVPIRRTTPADIFEAELADEADAMPDAEMAKPVPVPIAPPTFAKEKPRGLRWWMILLIALCAIAIAGVVAWRMGELDPLLTRFGLSPVSTAQPQATDPQVPAVFADAQQGEASQSAAAPTEAISPAMAQSTPRLSDFYAEPDTGATPLTVTFTVLTNVNTDNIRLLSHQGIALMGELSSTPADEGLRWTVSVPFDAPYTGAVYLYLRDTNGTWTDSGMTLNLNLS